MSDWIDRMYGEYASCPRGEWGWDSSRGSGGNVIVEVVPNDCSKCDGDFAYWDCKDCPKRK